MSLRNATFNLFIIIYAFIYSGAHISLAGNIPSIAIMNFTNQALDDPEWQWLGKGLADLLVTDLARTKKFQVVDREKMQDYLDEIDLSETGIVEQKTASPCCREPECSKCKSRSGEILPRRWISGREFIIRGGFRPTSGAEFSPSDSGPPRKVLAAFGRLQKA